MKIKDPKKLKIFGTPEKQGFSQCFQACKFVQIFIQ